MLLSVLTFFRISHSIATDQMEVVPKMSFAVNDVTSSLIVHTTGKKNILSEQSPQ